MGDCAALYSGIARLYKNSKTVFDELRAVVTAFAAAGDNIPQVPGSSIDLRERQRVDSAFPCLAALQSAQSCGGQCMLRSKRVR